jgi:hypothetical protein
MVIRIYTLLIFKPSARSEMKLVNLTMCCLVRAIAHLMGQWRNDSDRGTEEL